MARPTSRRAGAPRWPSWSRPQWPPVWRRCSSGGSGRIPSPVTPHARGLAVVLATVVLCLAWRGPVRWRTWAAPGGVVAISAWTAGWLTAQTVGSPFGYAGLTGDMGRLSTLVTRFTVTWTSADGFVEGLPAPGASGTRSHGWWVGQPSSQVCLPGSCSRRHAPSVSPSRSRSAGCCGAGSSKNRYGAPARRGRRGGERRRPAQAVRGRCAGPAASLACRDVHAAHRRQHPIRLGQCRARRRSDALALPGLPAVRRARDDRARRRGALPRPAMVLPPPSPARRGTVARGRLVVPRALALGAGERSLLSGLGRVRDRRAALGPVAAAVEAVGAAAYFSW